MVPCPQRELCLQFSLQCRKRQKELAAPALLKHCLPLSVVTIVTFYKREMKKKWQRREHSSIFQTRWIPLGSRGCWSLSQPLLSDGGVHHGQVACLCTTRGQFRIINKPLKHVFAHTNGGKHSNSTQKEHILESYQGLFAVRQES